MGEEIEAVDREVMRWACRREPKGGIEESKDTVMVSHNIQPDHMIEIPEGGIVEHPLPLQVLPMTQIIPRIRVQMHGASRNGAKEIRTGISMSKRGAKASLWRRIKRVLHWNGKDCG